MAIKQVSEKIIKRDFIKLNDNVKHIESDMYIKDGIVYKIIKPPYRETRTNSLYLIENNDFPHTNNIIDTLYQGDKLIGSTSLYLENYISMIKKMYNLDLYEIKIIMTYIIDFFKNAIDKKLLYWDLHLDNMGISNKEFYILDIDSMTPNPKQKNIQYALNNLFTLFYEMYYKKLIRNEYDNEYKNIIHQISGCKNILNYTLTLEQIKIIINNTSKDYLEEKRLILK